MTDVEADPWTVLRLLDWTTDFFKSRGSHSPRLDAEVLLAHARGCERIELYTAFDQIPSEEERTAFREMVRRRGDGAPVAYLVGYREFYSLRFRVTEDVLIPRPETEHLVIEAIEFTKSRPDQNTPLQVADVGTGSGAIAVALAVQQPNVHVVAVDTSEAALNIAIKNIAQHQVEDRVTTVCSDLLTNVTTPETFDLICSNPPYVSEAEYQSLSAEVRRFEPQAALLADNEGTEVIERLIEQSPSRLRSGGRLLIELSPMIAERCLDLVATCTHWTNAQLKKDLSGHARLLMADRK